MKVIGKNNYEYKQDDHGIVKKIEAGKALFHCFGVDYEELKNGPGNYSTAIIELSDGVMKNVPVDMIKFNDV